MTKVFVEQPLALPGSAKYITYNNVESNYINERRIKSVLPDNTKVIFIFPY